MSGNVADSLHSVQGCDASGVHLRLKHGLEKWKSSLLEDPQTRSFVANIPQFKESQAPAAADNLPPCMNVLCTRLSKALQDANVPQEVALDIQRVFETAAALCLASPRDQGSNADEQPQPLLDRKKLYPNSNRDASASATICQAHRGQSKQGSMDGTVAMAATCPVGHASPTTHAGLSNSAPSAMEMLGESHSGNHGSPSCPMKTKGSSASEEGNTYDDSFNGSANLYDRLGGWEVLGAAVDGMYHRLFNDPRTAPFFENRDEYKLMKHMTCFIAWALAGKVAYSPRRLYEVHRSHIRDLGMTGNHVDIMIEHLMDTLDSIGAPAELIQCATGTLRAQKWIFAIDSGFEEELLREEEQAMLAAQQEELGIAAAAAVAGARQQADEGIDAVDVEPICPPPTMHLGTAQA